MFFHTTYHESNPTLRCKSFSEIMILRSGFPPVVYATGETQKGRLFGAIYAKVANRNLNFFLSKNETKKMNTPKKQTGMSGRQKKVRKPLVATLWNKVKKEFYEMVFQVMRWCRTLLGLMTHHVTAILFLFIYDLLNRK